MSKMEVQLDDQRAFDRRAYYRINDAVALRVEKIAEDGMEQAIERYQRDHARLGLSNLFAHEHQNSLPEFKSIEERHPEIARYLGTLHTRIEQLARALAQSEDDMPSYPTHKVDISGNGIRFVHDKPLFEDGHVLMNIVLFPDRIRLLCIARVINCDEGDSEYGGAEFPVALEFVHIHDGDRELLVKHIYALQLQSLRSRQD